MKNVQNIKSELPAGYNVPDKNRNNDDETIRLALNILNGRIKKRGDCFTSPEHVRDFLRLKLEPLEAEQFCILFLDNRHRVIEFVPMFNGTIDGASVHPREVVKAALKYNASAVILAHNHPSGIAEPSEADKALTGRLKDALGLVDVRVLDHFIVGVGEITSLSERGLM